MSDRHRSHGRRRGRPPKYGQPARVIAATLPQDTIDALSAIHSDLGWAIVRLVEKTGTTRPADSAAADAQLVEIGGGYSLIVVDPALVRPLTGVQVVPLSERQAFLALAPGQGMADLELAVLDHVDTLDPGAPERAAAERLRDQLRLWRRDDSLSFEARAIIVGSRTGAATSEAVVRRERPAAPRGGRRARR